MILLELVKSKNRDLPYWTYTCFNLEKLSNDECLEEFRFMRNEISLCVTMVRGGSRTAATSKMERFVIIVSGF